jgi:hypothetical protein
MAKRAIRKTKGAGPFQRVVSRKATKLAVVSDRLTARERRVLLAMARALAGKSQ